ncbi:hypothetical protein K1719_003027 [Acacia pycnantha]|nr:hypothetical protein K1719_003027 [Acacia pycnantha]
MVKFGEQFASYFFFRLSYLVVRLKHVFLCAFFILVSSASAPSLSLCSVVDQRIYCWRHQMTSFTSNIVTREQFFVWIHPCHSRVPANVTLRLAGNPICKDSNIQNIGQYCASEGGESEKSMNSTTACPAQACPADNFYEYVTDPHVPCYCAAPLRIGYLLKSPSFSYFSPYRKFC